MKWLIDHFNYLQNKMILTGVHSTDAKVIKIYKNDTLYTFYRCYALFLLQNVHVFIM